MRAGAATSPSPPGGPAPRGGVVLTPPRRWPVPALAVAVLLSLLVGVGGHRLYAAPTLDRLGPGSRVDAVVALGGLTASADHARLLVERGAAPVLVLSNPYPPGRAPTVERACRGGQTGHRVICFEPRPSTTRGEAREIRALALAHGWDRVAVVAPTFHVSRARLLVQRCYSGTLLMLSPPLRVSRLQLAYQYAYQSAGYVKAGLLRGC